MGRVSAGLHCLSWLDSAALGVTVECRIKSSGAKDDERKARCSPDFDTHSQITTFSPKRGKTELWENLQRLLNDKKLPNANVRFEYHFQILLL